MPHIQPLRPGQEPTREQFNQLAAAANSRLQSVAGAGVQDGTTGAAIVPFKTRQPVWGKITKQGPDPDPDYPDPDDTTKAHYHEWTIVRYEHEVNESSGEPALDPRWLELRPQYTIGSHAAEDDEDVLLDPAVEINGNVVPIGAVVRLIPTESITDTHGNTHRLWLFSWEELRPFYLAEPLIPTGHVYHEDTAMLGSDVGANRNLIEDGKRETTIEGIWLDNLDQSGEGEPGGDRITLYASHAAVFEPADRFFNLGYGYASIHRGTGAHGWAKYVPHATILDYDENDNIIWRGEWQIVRLETVEILKGHVQNANPGDAPKQIQPGEVGEFWVWGIGPTGGADHVGFTIQVYNNLPVPLKEASKHNVYFNREFYIWVPLTVLPTVLYGKVQAGSTNGTGASTRAFSLQPCDRAGNESGFNVFDAWSQLKPTHDTALFEGYVVQYHIDSDGAKVIEGDIWDRPIGTILWESVDTANIRDGWRLCSGADGSPDLRGRFIMSIGPQADESAIGTIGNGEFPLVADGEGRSLFFEQDQVVDLVDVAFPGVLATDTNGDTMGLGWTEAMLSRLAVHEDIDEYDIRPRFYVCAAIQRYE